jgi:hypothetical protein
MPQIIDVPGYGPTEFPDGMTDADIISAIQKNMVPAKSNAPKSMTDDLAAFRKSQEDRQAKNFGSVANVLSGATAVPKGVLNLVSEGLGEKVFPSKFIDKESGEYAVGQLLDPAAWAIGGGAMKAAQAIPKAGQIIKGAIGGAVGGGAVGGLSEGGTAGEGAAIGGAIGGGVPAVGVALSKLTPKAKALVDSISSVFSKNGRTTIGHKMVLDQLQPAERAEVLKILQTRGIDASELGSDLTTSQALGYGRVGHEMHSPDGARVAALEKEVSKMPGGEGLQQRYAEQQGNQASVMNTLSGGRGGAGDALAGKSADDLAMEAAKTVRGNTAKALYPKGEVTGDSRLDEIMSRPAVETAERVVGTAEANVPKSMVTQGARPADTLMNTPKQYEQYSLDSLTNRYRSMETAANRLSKTGRDEEASAIRAAKNDLGKWLSEKYPEWAQANRMFAFQSRPVTRMEVGSALKSKMEQSPSAFLKATENVSEQEQMIRSATGRPNQSLGDVFNLGQMSKISGLRNEAQIGEEVKKLEGMARANLGDEKAFQLPNLLNIWVAIANKIAKTSAQASVDDVTRAAAEVLKNPAEMRKLLMQDAASKAKVGKAPVWAGGSGVYAAPLSGLMSGGQP